MAEVAATRCRQSGGPRPIQDQITFFEIECSTRRRDSGGRIRSVSAKRFRRQNSERLGKENVFAETLRILPAEVAS